MRSTELTAAGPIGLTVDQAAKLLQYHPKSILRFLRQGKLKGVRAGGGAWRIHRENIDEFLRKPPAREQATAERKLKRRA